MKTSFVHRLQLLFGLALVGLVGVAAQAYWSSTLGEAELLLEDPSASLAPSRWDRALEAWLDTYDPKTAEPQLSLWYHRHWDWKWLRSNEIRDIVEEENFETRCRSLLAAQGEFLKALPRDFPGVRVDGVDPEAKVFFQRPVPWKRLYLAVALARSLMLSHAVLGDLQGCKALFQDLVRLFRALSLGQKGRFEVSGFARVLNSYSRVIHTLIYLVEESYLAGPESETWEFRKFPSQEWNAVVNASRRGWISDREALNLEFARVEELFEANRSFANASSIDVCLEELEIQKKSNLHFLETQRPWEVSEAPKRCQATLGRNLGQPLLSLQSRTWTNSHPSQDWSPSRFRNQWNSFRDWILERREEYRVEREKRAQQRAQGGT